VNERKSFKKYKERKAKTIKKETLEEEKWGSKCIDSVTFRARWFLQNVWCFDTFSGYLHHSYSAALKRKVYELHTQQTCESS
jgi:hypothetical protein